MTGCRDDRVMLAECEESSDRVQGGPCHVSRV